MTVRPSQDTTSKLFPKLTQYLNERTAEFDTIGDERKHDLVRVADYVRESLSHARVARLMFICTHNSRRSHLAQIWTEVAARYYGVTGLETFSGGTEATALNPRAVAAMQRCGLKITADDPRSSNPRYSLFTSDDSEPIICFSKCYDAPPNPREGFCAVMTCSQADDACPIVSGCDLRMPIRYEDPKIADDTDHEAQRYDERCAQICREMMYLVSRI